MAIFKGNTEISNLYVGPDEVQEVYRGSDLIWSNSVQRSDAFWSDTVALWTHEPAGLGVTSWENQVTGTIDLTVYQGDNGNTSIADLQDGYWGTRLGKTNQSASGQGKNAKGAVLISTGTFPFGTGEFTIEFWTYQYGIITNPANDVISTLYDTTGNGSPVAPRWSIASTATEGQAKIATQLPTSPSTISTGVWQHHAIVRDSSNLVTYYLDGTAGSNTKTTSDSVGGYVATTLGGLNQSSLRAYSCNALFRQVRLTKAARYTGNFTPYQRFYYPGIV